MNAKLLKTNSAFTSTIHTANYSGTRENESKIINWR